MNITVDTNILRKAFHDFSMDHLDVVFLIRNSSHLICMDYQHKLFAEYENEMHDSKMFQEWYLQMAPDRVFFCSDRIFNNDKEKLVALGFHEESDHIVLGISFNSDKFLITEDSDFGKGNEERASQHQAEKNYITKQMNITLTDSGEAKSFLTKNWKNE